MEALPRHKGAAAVDKERRGRSVIRGIGRYTVEISRTGSPYFERAICFVRPEFARSGRLDLHRAARQLVRSLGGGVECVEGPEGAGEGADAAEAAEKTDERRPSRRQWGLVPVALLSALLGAAAAFWFCLSLSAAA